MDINYNGKKDKIKINYKKRGLCLKVLFVVNLMMMMMMILFLSPT